MWKIQGQRKASLTHTRKKRENQQHNEPFLSFFSSPLRIENLISNPFPFIFAYWKIVNYSLSFLAFSPLSLSFLLRTLLSLKSASVDTFRRKRERGVIQLANFFSPPLIFKREIAARFAVWMSWGPLSSTGFSGRLGPSVALPG